MPRNTAIFIDGFNVYHFIISNGKKYLWLDYTKLASLLAPHDNIISINYFSAIAYWSFDKMMRHQKYLQVLNNSGLVIELGVFADKDKIGLIRHRDGSRKVSFFGKTFQAIREKLYTHEEKQTDVSMGVKMYRAATLGTVDKIILLSNDTDFVPALREISFDFPNVRLKVYAPVSRELKLPSSIRKIVSQEHHRHLNFVHIKKSQFPNTVTLASGDSVTKPADWS